MIDFIIVGGGLAGIHFANQCLSNNKTFLLIDTNKNNASKVAAGVYNPVILKRYTLSWDAKNQLSLLDKVYKGISSFTNLEIDFKIPLRRRLFSIEEQNNWYLASEKSHLSDYLITPILFHAFRGIISNFGFGEVSETGFVNTKVLIDSFISKLSLLDCYENSCFDYDLLKMNNQSVIYKNIEAKHIIFAEGFYISQNPFFNALPIIGSKGEVLTIKAPDLALDFILKGNVFILPLGNHLFKVGSTYSWDFLNDEPTEEGLQYLQKEIESLISVPFTIIAHEAGIRPASRDRKPIIGTHPKHSRLHVLNGLGTRGVMIAPSMALQLYRNISEGIPIDPEADLKRFKKIIW
jgi:glycine/D-amino acid oxidase-like deaminating enzyme